jgi:hypothetical protein
VSTKRTETLRAQMGPFAMVPVWLLERCKDSRAIHLYATLGRFANREGRAWPARQALAEALDVSSRSLDRAIASLVEAGGLQTSLRHRADGAVIGVDYLLVQIDPSSESDLLATGGEKGDADHFATDGEKAAADHSATDGEKDSSHFATGADHFATGGDAIRRSRSNELDPRTRGERAREDAQPPLLSVQVVEPSAADFVALWNTATSLPILRCHRLTEKRRQHVRARLAERPWEEWRAIVARIEQSAFCRGTNARGWVASFDWLVSSPDVAVKALEGVYDDRAKPERPFTATELADAGRMRIAAGGCMHDPRCAEFQACIATIIREWRLKREGTAA